MKIAFSNLYIQKLFSSLLKDMNLKSDNTVYSSVKKIIVCGLCLIFVSACDDAPPPPAQTNTTNNSRMPQSNKPMPPINTEKSMKLGWSLIDGTRRKVSDYQGQVVILDFWATYCPPCLEGTPHFVNLQKKYGPEGLHVIGLNVGGDDDKPKIADFIRRFGVQYDIGYPDDELVQLYMQNDDSIPQTFVLDRHGRVVEHIVGFTSEIGAKIDNAVKNALTARVE